MTKLSYDQLFHRRVEEKQADFRAFLETAEAIRQDMQPGYDRDEAVVIEMRILLHGGKTLKGAHSESLTKIADFARRNAPNHPSTPEIERTARSISSYHYSRMR